MDFTGAARRRSPQAFARAARFLGCEIAAIQAVVDVETAGSGFDGRGRPKALYEPHVFYRCSSGRARDRAVKAGLAYPKWRKGNYPKDSYARIDAACAIDETAALKATSWGLPQILGENYEAAGFDSPQDMVAAFCESEDAQIEAMANFIVANGLAGHLRTKNWVAFARAYNGPAYAEHNYHGKLATAYRKRSTAAPARFMASPDDIEDPRVEQAPTWAAPVDQEHADIMDHDPASDREVTARVQERLRELGYFEVGKVDGELTERTKDAILTFRRRNGLPLLTSIDDEFLAAIEKARPKPVAADRAEATADDLRAEGSETMGIIDRFKGWAGKIFGFGGGTGVIAIATERTNEISGAKDAVEGLGFSSETWSIIITVGVMALIVAGIGLAIWFIVDKFEQKRVLEYRMGKNT
jgi:hypothetical protein